MLSPEIERVILKAMEPVPGDRYPSIQALRLDLPQGDASPPLSEKSMALPEAEVQIPPAAASQAVVPEKTSQIQSLTTPIPASSQAPSEQAAEPAEHLVSVTGRTTVSESAAAAAGNASPIPAAPCRSNDAT